jgi:hypothetical protein
MTKNPMTCIIAAMLRTTIPFVEFNNSSSYPGSINLKSTKAMIGKQARI